MKTKLILHAILLLLAAAPIARPAEPFQSALQQGLYEEEANHNLEAAIRAYQSVVAQHNEQRKPAATAIFRLGECYRKLGRTNDASAQYQRVLRDFADQTVLVEFSRQNLTERPSLASAILTDEEEKELKQIKAIIRDSPDLINAKTKTGRSRLEDAAAFGQVKVAEFLLANGADVNANLGGAGTPLHRAAQSGHKTMTELLLRNRADVNSRESGATPLHLAVDNGHKAITEVLLAHKADVNAKGKLPVPGVAEDNTPLHIAASKGFAAIAELLLARGAQVNASDRTGRTPLHAAASRELRVVQLLLTHQADVKARDNEGWTPLHVAINLNQLAIARLLLENQAEANARVLKGQLKDWTPLHLAAFGQGDRAMTELLLAHKAEVDAVTSDGQTPLIIAAGKPKPEVVEAILAGGANVNVEAANRQTALRLAIQGNDERTVSAILARKPNLEVRADENLTVLQRAVVDGRESVVEMLLRAGANPNVSYDRDGNTPLHWAVVPGKKNILKLLLAYKANVNARNLSGQTPLDLTKQTRPGLLPPRTSSDQSAFDDIAALLKEAGADDQMQRRTAISISRDSRGYLAAWFVQGSNTWNRFTLLELLASVYSQGSVVEFPDFAHVRISRLGSAGGKSTEIAVDADALIRSGDCSKDVALEWGDVVEIPERDRKLNERWNGLPGEFIQALKHCVERAVEIKVKGESTKLTLTQTFFNSSQVQLSTPQSSMFWLSSAVRSANTLRASSDLLRVRVLRVDPVTKQPQEIILNAEKADPRTDLWLRDGDMIEVPDKP